MANWSLRTKLVAALAATLAPALALAAWSNYAAIQFEKARRTDIVAEAVERVASREHELIDGARRTLAGACGNEIVQKSLDPAVTPDEIQRCQAYLGNLVRQFPEEYSAVIVLDETGVARCASVPAVQGVNFADREIFRLVRDSQAFSVGAYVASRATPNTIIPTATPFLVDGKFHGMCAMGISLGAFAQLPTPQASAHALAIRIVDRLGLPVGGAPGTAFELPVATRLAAAIADRQTVFTDYGQNGQRYEFHVLPLGRSATFAVIVMPEDGGIAMLAYSWGRFALIVVVAAIALGVTWFAADRWCVRPLRYIEAYAGRVSRGEETVFAPESPWAQELVTMGEAVRQMADGIASRQKELKVGLEQRDHMLREIHHRVKNNLQMISSLLNLQAGEIRSPRIRRFFGDAQNRVLTLSILHRHLYERSSWSLVDFQQFISDLVRQISVSRPGVQRPNPRYHIRAPIMAVGPDVAIPVGLIVTEAVGSALNHDFGAVATPEIRIEAIDKGNDDVELVIEDNGVDTRRGSIGPARGGFGLTLIRGLAMQLGGEARVESTETGGTRVVVAFHMVREEASA